MDSREGDPLIPLIFLGVIGGVALLMGVGALVVEVTLALASML